MSPGPVAPAFGHDGAHFGGDLLINTLGQTGLKHHDLPDASFSAKSGRAAAYWFRVACCLISLSRPADHLSTSSKFIIVTSLLGIAAKHRIVQAFAVMARMAFFMSSVIWSFKLISNSVGRTLDAATFPARRHLAALHASAPSNEKAQRGRPQQAFSLGSRSAQHQSCSCRAGCSPEAVPAWLGRCMLRTRACSGADGGGLCACVRRGLLVELASAQVGRRQFSMVRLKRRRATSKGSFSLTRMSGHSSRILKLRSKLLAVQPKARRWTC